MPISQLVISPGHCPGGGKGICTVPLRLHKGEFGPVTTFALRAGDAPNGKRDKWDGRHQVMRKNDYMAPNVRSYFDRPVGRTDIPVVPRPQLRPTWVLDVPKDPNAAGGMYRIFDARQAQWIDQWQWMPKRGLAAAPAPAPTEGDAPVSPTALAASASAPALLPAISNQCKPKKIRTPRKPADLIDQRSKEKEWDKIHGTVFSRFNSHNHANFRSYFDRWKDDGGGNNSNECTWRLTAERKPPGAFMKSMSEPDPFKDRGGLPGQPAWISNYSSKRDCDY